MGPHKDVMDHVDLILEPGCFTAEPLTIISPFEMWKGTSFASSTL